MKKIIYILVLVLSLLVMTFVNTRQVQAALGGPAESVKADRKAMAATRGAVTVHRGYTVEEMVSKSTTIREYITPAGIVFGIAWNGLVHPDLAPLLGSYADDYKKALRETPRKPGRRYQHVKTNDIIVEKWGHMRNLQGRAYAPALVPSGVSLDEIK